MSIKTTDTERNHVRKNVGPLSTSYARHDTVSAKGCPFTGLFPLGILIGASENCMERGCSWRDFQIQKC